MNDDDDKKNDIEMLDFIEDDDMEKSAQWLSNYDLYGPLSNPLTHLQDYPSIDAAKKERQKRRKKILEMALNTRPDRYVAKVVKVKPKKKVKVKLK